MRAQDQRASRWQYDYNLRNYWDLMERSGPFVNLSQLTFTCSKSTVKIQGESVKYVQS